MRAAIIADLDTALVLPDSAIDREGISALPAGRGVQSEYLVLYAFFYSLKGFAELFETYWLKR
jgi:hypothetical protein